jgi:hypothetical protein
MEEVTKYYLEKERIAREESKVLQEALDKAIVWDTENQGDIL